MKFPSFEHVGSLPATSKFLDSSVVVVEKLARSVGFPGPDESWMDGLSAADVIRQFGIDPNAILTPEGKLGTPEGDAYEPASSESTENSSSPDESASDTSHNSRSSTDGRKQLKLKLTTKIKQAGQGSRTRSHSGFPTERLSSMPSAAW